MYLMRIFCLNGLCYYCMKNLIHYFPTCCASVKKPIGELNLQERALDEDTGVYIYTYVHLRIDKYRICLN